MNSMNRYSRLCAAAAVGIGLSIALGLVDAKREARALNAESVRTTTRYGDAKLPRRWVWQRDTKNFDEIYRK